MLGRPKRPTSETLARILAGDDASPIAVESDKYDSVHDEQRDLLRKLKNIGVVQIPASVQTIEQLRCFYAERCKSGTVNGLVRHCPLCEETKHRDEFPRRGNPVIVGQQSLFPEQVPSDTRSFPWSELVGE